MPAAGLEISTSKLLLLASVNYLLMLPSPLSVSTMAGSPLVATGIRGPLDRSNS